MTHLLLAQSLKPSTGELSAHTYLIDIFKEKLYDRNDRLDAGVLTEFKNRGVKDILIACVDCLKGLPMPSEV